jgi:hypothetical protein
MSIDPAMSAELSMTIKNFLEESNNGVILLDGVEYLIVHNNFTKVLKILHDLNEAMAVHRAILIIPIDKRTFKEREYALLMRDMKMLNGNGEYSPKPVLLKGKSEQKLVTV